MLSSNQEVKNNFVKDESGEKSVKYLMGTSAQALAYLVSLVEGKQYSSGFINYEFEWPINANYDIRLNGNINTHYKVVYLVEASVDEATIIKNAQGNIDSFLSTNINQLSTPENPYFLPPKVGFVGLYMGPSQKVTLEYAKNTLEGKKSVSCEFNITDSKYSYIYDFLDYATDYFTSDEYIYLHGEAVDPNILMALAHEFAAQYLYEKNSTRTRRKLA